MCDQKPSYHFDDNQQASILDAVLQRRDGAIRYLVEVKGFTRERAEAQNELGNHIRGELTERAVSHWLNDNEILHSRPKSPEEEMGPQKLPNILTTERGI